MIAATAAAASGLVAGSGVAAPTTAPSSNTDRENFTLRVDGQRVVGIYHRPQNPRRKSPGVAIFHGFMGNKTDPHRIYFKTAQRRADVGVASVRIDLRGRGDSDGESIDATPQKDFADAKAAVEYLAQQPEVDANRLGVIGLSWGGSLAAILAGQDPRIKAAALWSNVPQSSMDWRPKFFNLDGRQVSDQWGYLVCKQFYDALASINTLDEIAKTKAPLLLVYGSADDSVHQRDVDAFVGRMKDANVSLTTHVVDGADHIFMRYQWEKELLDVTIPWIAKQLMG
jgi:dienelactone hydrolase